MTYLAKPKLHHPDLPRNKLGRAQLTKLKIYVGPEHPHEAQAPITLEV